MLVFQQMYLVDVIFSWKGIIIVILINSIYLIALNAAILFCIKTNQEIYPWIDSHNMSSLIEFYRSQEAVLIGVDLNSSNYIYTVSLCLFGLICLHLGNFLSAGAVLRKINQRREYMSEKSYKAQKQMTIMLILQNCYPVIAISLPVVISTISAFADFEMQGSLLFKHFCACAFIFYPIVSAFFGFYFVKPHREFILRNVRSVFWRIPFFSTKIYKVSIGAESTISIVT